MYVLGRRWSSDTILTTGEYAYKRGKCQVMFANFPALFLDFPRFLVLSRLAGGEGESAASGASFF